MSTDARDDRSWLELLLAGASLSALEALRTRKLHDAPADGVAQVEAEAGRAVHLHALLAERKRHAAELTVLNDMARQLTALRHPNDVLQEVATQTRRLLGVDVAYIMRARDDDVLRIEVVDGSIGTVLRGIELPRGVGLGGRVMESGQPYWSEDYVGDSQLRHDGGVDHAAGLEQLGGILGVPLRVGESTIGVLLAADRRARAFSEDDVSLLVALAAHASVAIHNAELFDQYHRTAESLQRSSASIRRTIDLHERLTALVLGGRGLSDVIAAIGEALAARVAVLQPDDDSGSVDPSDGASIRIPALAALAKDFADPHDRSTRVGVEGATSWAAAPIVVAEQYAGSLVAVHPAAFDDEGRRLLETSATVVGLMIASDHAVAEAERRAQGELVAALLGGHTDDSTLRRRAAAASVDLHSIRCVVVLEPRVDELQMTAGIGSALAREARGWSAEYHGEVVVLLPIDDPVAVRELVRRSSAEHPVTAAVASTAGSAIEVRAGYRRAKDTIGLLSALGRTGTCVIADETSLYQSLFSQAGRGALARFVEATVGPLLSYDESQHSDLAGTLEAYLARGTHHATTADALHIHVNTLYQRLNRVDDILGATWRGPDHAIEVQLALRLNRLAQTLVQ